MSTQANEARIEIDEEPEEGEIQDDDGSLEDVSSDEEIPLLAKARERGAFPQNFTTLRGQFVKKERQLVNCNPRREVRFCPSGRTDLNLKKSEIRAKSGYRTTGLQGSYYESLPRYKSPKEHNQKVSGKIHEKENKAKESKRTRRRSLFHDGGSESRSAYNGSEHTESYFSSSSSSKSLWHKGDVKEKHKKKKKNGSSKICNPLGEVCASQLKTGRESTCFDKCTKSGENSKDNPTCQRNTDETVLSTSSSPTSDIQILEVPVVVPEVITIIDSDDDGENVMKKGDDGCKDDDGCILQLHIEKEVVEEDDANDIDDADVAVVEDDADVPDDADVADDPDDNLKLLREAALKSSKPETCVKIIQDDEVLQLRLEALRSAIIRKCEERKKRGITLVKPSRNAGEKQVMSISPLGSPNYRPSGDSSICGSDDGDCDSNSPFEFNMSTNHNGVTDPTIDSEMDKISIVDMELAESDEEKENIGTDNDATDHTTIAETAESECNSYKGDNELLDVHAGECEVMYQVDDVDDPVSSQHGSPLSPLTEHTVDAPVGYIIGDAQSPGLESEMFSLQFQSLFDSQAGSTECANDEEYTIEDKICLQGHADKQVDENILESSLCEQNNANVQNQPLEVQSLEMDSMLNLEIAKYKNYEHLTAMSNRSDSSCLSPMGEEMDLESMIILDEVGSSDDERSECSEREVLSFGKFQSKPCEEFENTSEICDSGNVPELCETNSVVNLCVRTCNSISSNENVPVYSDNFEASEDNTEIFRKNSGVKLCSTTSNLRSPDDEKACIDLEISEKHGDNTKTCEEVPDLTLKMILSNTEGSSDLPFQGNKEPSKLIVSDESSRSAMCGTSHLTCFDLASDADIKVDEIRSETIDSVSTPSKQSVVKFFSEENEGSLSSLAGIEECKDKSIVQTVSPPTCEETFDCSSHDTDPVHKIFEQGNDFHSSEGKLQQAVNTCNADNMIHMRSGDKSQETIAEDDETVLRDNLLAMLKKHTEKLSIRDNSEADHPKLDQDIDAHQESSMNKSENAKNESAVPFQTASCINTLKSIDSRGKNDKQLLLKPLSLPSCASKVQQKPLFNSLSKCLTYSSHSTSLNKCELKRSNNVRSSKVHVPGRFNVNVPKLVINLGEDSDSGEDETVKLDSVSSVNEGDASEEYGDKLPSSQVVPADFEKKLDLLLKQARFQQEASAKDEKEILTDNTDLFLPCLNETGNIPSRSNVGKNTKSISVSNDKSIMQTISVRKELPLVARGVTNLRGKNISSMLNRNKIVSSGNNINVSKTSTGRAVDANKRDIHSRIKSSVITNAGSSVSSAVDIRLLPSSKQKEYIQLKRQLEQLTRKEREIKTKASIRLIDATRLPVRNSGMKETALASADVENSMIKNNVGINVDRSSLIRKFVRRGQGGSVIPGTELSKTRLIVRTIPTSNSSTSQLQNRLTVTAPNRVGGISKEKSPLTRHVLCLPQKRIVTALNSGKKMPPGFQITTPNVDVTKHSKFVDVKTPTVCSNKLSKLIHPGKVTRTNCDEQNTHIMECLSETVNKTQKKVIGKAALKRKRSASELLMPSQKKIVTEQILHDEKTTDEPHLGCIDSQNVQEVQEEKCTSRLTDQMQISCDGENIPLPRRNSISEDSEVSVQDNSVVPESTKLHIEGEDPSRIESETMDYIDRNLEEGLWSSECQLISKRYQVLEDIASVQLSLHEIGKVSELKQQIIKDIQRLQEAKNQAEAQLRKKEELLKLLYSDVENTKRDIMRRQSETLLLSVECEKIGCEVHGSNYRVPNACTDLIRNGMATVSNTLQCLKEGKSATEPEFEIPSLCSSGAMPNVIHAMKMNTSEFEGNLEHEDSSSQVPGSYFSPLGAMKKPTEPSNENQVLCPYQIMGSCKDKECFYLH